MLDEERFPFGVARRQEAVEVMGRWAVDVAVRSGALSQPWRGVLVDASRATDPLTRAAAALLACGDDAVLARQTAAAIHGCTAAASPQVHVLVPYLNWVRTKSGLIVHHDRFNPEDVVTRHGLPVTELDLTISELLCTERRWVALACLDQALHGRSENDAREFVRAVKVRLVRRDDRRGVSTAKVLLALGDGGAESPQESRLRLLVVDSGFPVPVTQWPILSASGKLIYKLDLAWPELRIALEYDGYEAHEGKEDYDAERDRRLAARGWLVIHVRKNDILEPAAFLSALRRAFDERRFSVAA